ncbi:uncharacterized protein LY79DRAFT_693683 [Colletotrichum navitas]|uniref:Nitrate reductase n=1 Tax=Colletotrichum navitas TaxID=681940 RepID=A0AAD8UZY1_9PEZI|nr:uncharacterized protein LY79DRAFT_693683 [Colletotrichum navitas]KAK1579680.1 hypothetical protein LY79DRAFT_693683 [Colletotrichum navitas]
MGSESMRAVQLLISIVIASSWKSIHHADRLTYPLRTFWDEAMDFIVQRSKYLIKRLTSHGIAFYTSGQLFLEEYYALAVVGKAGLSTLHMDGNTRLCTATAAASMRESFGHNVAATQTVLWSRMLDRFDDPNPPKLVVIDPRVSDTARRATVHLAPGIGTNLAVLNGIQHLMLKRAGSTKNLEGAAKIIRNSQSLLSTALQGVYQSNQATASACQINNISLLRGLIGKPSSAVEPPGEARSDLDIFLDYGRRMDFRDKNGNLLLPYKDSEEVFCAWKRLLYGRPCDYSGLSLFDICESFGHDLETGAPYTKAEYAAFNPAGRAILKSCRYTPSMENPMKSTHSAYLRDACPEPQVHISREDAANMDVRDGDNVIVESRRGAIELKAKVGGISIGRAFIPFHFGYWDAKNGNSRAANELTAERWDPISNQPMFKSGAVRIEKIKLREKPYLPEPQSAAEQSCSTNGVDFMAMNDSLKRKRQLETWLGETYESIKQLFDIYTNLLPNLISDLEIEGGFRVMRRITEEVNDRLSVEVDKFGEDVRQGSREAMVLREAIFPPINTQKSPYEIMETLQGLHIYLSFNALIPVSQACWDKELLEAVQFGQTSTIRMQAWVNQQVKVRAPQSLLVPALQRD